MASDVAQRNEVEDAVKVRCPADLPSELLARIKGLTQDVITAFGVRDLAQDADDIEMVQRSEGLKLAG